jgi:hypothetical protein
MSRDVPCPAGQKRQPTLEPGEDLSRLQHLDASRRELDRQWKSVEAIADLGHLAIRRKPWPNRFCPFAEEEYGLVRGKRRDGKRLLPGDV